MEIIINFILIHRIKNSTPIMTESLIIHIFVAPDYVAYFYLHERFVQNVPIKRPK